MEPLMSHDSFTAFTSETGIHIEEKKKGALKMVLVFMGISILMVILGFILGLFVGDMGRAIGFFFIWGGALIFVISLIAFFLKIAINADPKITFDTTTNTLTLRGKVFPFADIDQIAPQMQLIMGRTMVMAMLIIKGKKKSLFSTGIVVSDPAEMQEFVATLDQLVQTAKSKKDTEA